MKLEGMEQTVPCGNRRSAPKFSEVHVVAVRFEDRVILKLFSDAHDAMEYAFDTQSLFNKLGIDGEALVHAFEVE